MMMERQAGLPKVLLVDDEPDTLHLIRKILQAEGYQIFLATNGIEALDSIEKNSPDLLLLDLVMPQLDGMEVLKRLRIKDKVTGVIMVSALSSENLVVQAMVEGADDFVGKPFTLKTIRVRLRQALEKSRLRKENLLLQQELQEAHDKIRTIFSRYMAAPVVERLLSSPTLPRLGGERHDTTVLFMDFSGFTSLAHELEPDRVLNVLNEHLALATEAILAQEGTIDKFIGDGVMALFNAPFEQEDHAQRAVRCAVTLRDRITSWGQANDPALKVRIGVHTGETLVGNIGTPEFMNYTAIGDAVNVAKRLQEACEANTILISEDSANLLPDDMVNLKPLGQTTVRGRTTPVAIYQVESLVGETGS